MDVCFKLKGREVKSTNLKLNTVNCTNCTKIYKKSTQSLYDYGQKFKSQQLAKHMLRGLLN